MTVAYKYRDDVIEYGEKAQMMKRLFTENGFTIVYDRDLDELSCRWILFHNFISGNVGL